MSSLIYQTIYSIYVKTNILNNKKYVGFSNDVEARQRQHIRDANNGSKCILHKAMRKYGNENFSLEIIYESLDRTHILEMETYFIKKYESYWQTGKGYNMTFGGEGASGYKHTPEELENLSKRFSGSGNPMFGKPCSDERKRNISNSLTGLMVGEKNPFYGKHHTENMRKYLGEKSRGRKASDSTRKKMSESHKKRFEDPAIRQELSKRYSGSANPMFGKHHTEESKQKSREKHLGKIPWNKGIPRTDEEKQKMSKNRKGKRRGKDHPNYGKPISKEQRNQISKTLTGRRLTEEQKQTRRRNREAKKLLQATSSGGSHSDSACFQPDVQDSKSSESNKSLNGQSDNCLLSKKA